MPGDLTAARQAAHQLLLDQRLYSLSVDVTALRYKKRVVFDSMQSFCGRTRATLQDLRGSDLQDGCTIVRRSPRGTVYLVLYNQEAKSTRRRAFTLAHEVGHICLEHREDGDSQEAEANCFAAELLMPQILLYYLIRRSPTPPEPAMLCGIFNLSRQAAALGLERLQRQRKPHFSLAERRLLERYGHLLPDPLGPVVDF